MNWLEFFSSLVASVSWPIAFVIAALVFREPLRQLMKRMTDVELFGNKATFKSQIEEAESAADQIPRLIEADGAAPPIVTPPPPDDYLEMASKYPSAAVIEAYKKVEAVLNEWQDAQGSTHSPSNPQLVKWLVDDGALSKNAYELYQTVARTRNIAVHTNTQISVGEAIAYRDLCQTLAYYLRDAIGKFQRHRNAKSGVPHG